VSVHNLYVCAICGEETARDNDWLLIVENRWQDKLTILQWSDRLAPQAGIHHVCSPSHVQELVVHWMTTGSLDYPFAQVPRMGAGRKFRQRLLLPGKVTGNGDDVDTSGACQVGELSVHRESLQRVLSDSPQSLATILEALLKALRRNPKSVGPEIEPEVEPLCGVGREV
jgi:hypothetical protein